MKNNLYTLKKPFLATILDKIFGKFIYRHCPFNIFDIQNEVRRGVQEMILQRSICDIELRDLDCYVEPRCCKPSYSIDDFNNCSVECSLVFSVHIQKPFGGYVSYIKQLDVSVPFTFGNAYYLGVRADLTTSNISTYIVNEVIKKIGASTFCKACVSEIKMSSTSLVCSSLKCSKQLDVFVKNKVRQIFQNKLEETPIWNIFVSEIKCEPADVHIVEEANTTIFDQSLPNCRAYVDFLVSAELPFVGRHIYGERIAIPITIPDKILNNVKK